MRRYPRLATTIHGLRAYGLGWAVRRVREELRTPTSEVTTGLARGLEKGRRAIRRSQRTRLNPVPPNTVVAAYELTAGSVGFDFAFFLVFAEAFAASHGREAIFILFVQTEDPGEDEQTPDQAYDAESVRWRFNNIVLPLATMHEAVSGFAVLPRDVDVDAYLDGAEVYPPLFSSAFRPRFDYLESLPTLRRGEFRGLKAPPTAVRHVEDWMASRRIDRPMVAITLRQRAYDPVRNSNVGQWVAFARWLAGEGYAPVFVPDTDSAWDLAPELAEFGVFHEAPWNLALRMALYERAFVNYFFSNGPAALATLNARTRYIAYNPPNELSRHATAEALDSIGWKVGQEGFHFAAPGQLQSWKSDDFVDLREDFQAFVDRFGTGLPGR